MSSPSLSKRQSITFVIYILLLIAVAYGVKQIVFAPAPQTTATQTTVAMRQKLEPAIDLPAKTGQQTIVLAGGCFWGVEGVFEKLQGVSNVVSGYTGGTANTANYGVVSSGTTGHAEAVQITYDPQQISFGQLLKVFFVVAHNPTEIDRQGPDRGAQYRSAIFFTDSEQQRVAQAYIDQLNRAKIFPQPIATKLTTLDKFYPAEEHHQNFIQHNPNYPYVLMHDRPKLDQLQQQFPEMVKKIGA